MPVPDVPPFTAFVGNLTFETDEEELRGFFSAQSPTSVRLVKDPTGKPKGFGYVEFGSRQGLVDALDKGMTMLGGRTIRVSVAEPRSFDSFLHRSVGQHVVSIADTHLLSRQQPLWLRTIGR